MIIESIDPATEQVQARYETLTDAELESRIAAAASAEQTHRSTSVETRVQWIKAAKRLLAEQEQRLAETISREMGKPIGAATLEIRKCMTVCDYYAENGPSLLLDRQVETNAHSSFVRYLPLGVVLAIMPWNFPFWQVFRFAIPALMAGNVVLLKHAENTLACSALMETIFHEAGVPSAGFQSLVITVEQTQSLLADARIRAATFTGSEQAGKAVAETSGRHLKKVVLELGGSDPFIVMPSADLERAVADATRGRLGNCGQSCIAAKRLIVHNDIYTEFRDALVASFESQSVGMPLEPGTDIGPMATEALRARLDEQVDETVARGAKALIGHHRLDRPGWFYPPTILEDIPTGSPAASEELFGPVASLFRANDFNDALRIANDTRFGLGSALFTRDANEIERAFNEIDAGATFINSITASDARLPFGGIRNSGYGRELAAEGMHEFMNLKTCWVA
ncbi:MAG: NAD-dependent succinate-semialdehyde dehydrogenase [Pseudomonadota bacterium]